MSTVVVSRTFPRPIEDVWAAITVPEAVARWLAPSGFKAEVGHRFPARLDHAGAGGQLAFEAQVTEVEPPRALALAANVGGQAHTVRFELAPVAGGTAVTVRHGGFGGLFAAFLEPTIRRVWDTILNERLAGVLEEVAPGGDEVA